MSDSILTRLWNLAKALLALAPSALARQPQANAFNTNAQGLAALKPLIDSADEVEIDVGGVKVEKTNIDGKTRLVIRDARAARPAPAPTPAPAPLTVPRVVQALPPPDPPARPPPDG